MSPRSSRRDGDKRAIMLVLSVLDKAVDQRGMTGGQSLTHPQALSMNTGMMWKQ